MTITAGDVAELVERLEHQAISWDGEDALDARDPDEEARFCREVKALLIALSHDLQKTQVELDEEFQRAERYKKRIDRLTEAIVSRSALPASDEKDSP